MREYLQASQAPTPTLAWNVIEAHLRAIARAHPENVTKVPERPRLQKQKNMKKLEELNIWMEVLLAYNGLQKPLQVVKRANLEDGTGYELCALISLCRPDLLDLKTVDPNSKRMSA
ncbi:MAG: hypothetical protein JSS10_08935 [Verrucomicrobia bacterium]|nr:hypothetical protein [Verrucomicrobiota bacterium]